jgi:DNA-binding XRE family transcriptional regulator
MTTLATTSQSGFEPRSTRFNQPAETSTSPSLAPLYELRVPELKIELPDGYARIREYVAGQETNPEMAAEIRAARATLAAVIQTKDNKATLRSMRLSRGMSQTQLAAKVGTSQSQVARIETGNQDPTIATLARFAVALEASIGEVAEAFIAIKS